MPSPRRVLRPSRVLSICVEAFAATGPDRFGLEAEWPVWGGYATDGRPGADLIEELDGTALPRGGKLTFEPGGQVELSSAPHADLPSLFGSLREDEAAIHRLLADRGYMYRASAVDVLRPPRRILQRSRYQSMEAHFGGLGSPGTWMMCNTASTQVNISHLDSDPFARWHLMNALVPVLIACFANSPGRDSHGQQWASLRQGIWMSTDPSRTSVVGTPGQAPAIAWASYAMGARVMMLGARCDSATPPAIDPDLTFGRWMAEGHPLGWPTEDDLRCHLTTLFPPVRPRGWLEIRVIDALPTWLREACTLIIAAACVPEVIAQLSRRLPDTHGLSLEAARHGLAHPRLAAAAVQLLSVVTDYLGAVTTSHAHHALVEEFAQRYACAGRCPADDRTRIRLPIGLTSYPVPLAG